MFLKDCWVLRALLMQFAIFTSKDFAFSIVLVFRKPTALLLALMVFQSGYASAQAVENSSGQVKLSSLIVTLTDVELTLQKIQPASTAFKQTPVKNPIGRLLWLPSEYGVLPQEQKIAEGLAEQGIESWFVDFYEAMFLSPTPSAVDEIPVEWTKAIIEQAQQDGLPLWIIAPNKAAQTVLRGLQFYLQQPKQQLGLILVNPNLYLNTPVPGQLANYWPQVANSNLPISILQAELSPWRWRVTSLAESLATAGSDVFVHHLPQVRDRYYFRPDASNREKQQALKLDQLIVQVMNLQQPYMQQSRQVSPLQVDNQIKVKQTRSSELQPYQGAQNLALALPNLTGERYDLKAYQDKVVLVNFWASWCPPCVHEMPSMARLKTHYAQQDFEILAVNLGEEKSQVEKFLIEHPVNFPVLLDAAVSAVKEWNVFAYPSSYLIDKKGQIRLALFGGTEWDEVHHLQKIDALLAE